MASDENSASSATGRGCLNTPATSPPAGSFPASPVYLGQLVRQLVLQAPAPVVAFALGYNNSTTTKMLTEAGGIWTSYPGGHDGR